MKAKRSNKTDSIRPEFVSLYFKSSKVPVFLFNDAWDCIDVNNSACDLLGYSEKKLTSLNARDILRINDPQNKLPDLGNTNQDGLHGRFEFICKKKPNLFLSLFSTSTPSGWITFGYESGPGDQSRDIKQGHNIRLTESKFARAQEIASLGSWGWNLVTDEIFWTDQTFRIFGLPIKPDRLRLSDFIGRVNPSDKVRVSRAIQTSINNGKPYFIEHRIIQPSGEDRIVRQLGEVTFDKENKPVFFDGTIQDITVEHEEKQRLDLLAKVFEKSLEAAIVADENSRIIEVNPSFETITGYSFNDVKGKSPSILSSGRHPQEFYKKMWQRIQNLGYWEGEIWDRKKDGSVYACQMNIVKFEDELNHKKRYLAVFADITALKESETKLKQLAFYDSLTSLPNRSFFIQELADNLIFCARNELQLALLFMDLDGFKAVNDSMGHAAGDEVLMQVGELLSSATRESDHTARLGGDEFVISIMKIGTPQDAALVAKKIISKFKEPFMVEGQEIFLGMSIGISIFPTDGSVADQLLQHADSAMYYAKKGGKGRYRFYAAEMETAARKRISLETNLFHALERDEFLVHYQPIVHAESNEIRGVEALVRWHTSQGEIVPPGDFIPIAEENRLILQIDHFVLETACRQLYDWNKQLANKIYISVNLSQINFHNNNSADIILDIIRKTGLELENLVIEITEKHLFDERSETIRQLNYLKEKNIRISIDDFGTGYSSLRYLKQMPLSQLKMDENFVRDIVTDDSIAKSILGLADNLDLMAVAEGVETETQVSKLQELGCEIMQGHYFSEPLQASEFGKLIKKKKLISV
ncbi:MAG: EAL domain-containing protein [Proteobacteria bacterium]|nr:EAL domain-containing protein [Pseudomonadota bacterium]